jgi:hypothetical protein
MNAFLSKINWFGLAGGIITIIVVIVSLLVPWWELTVGDDFLKASVSPVNTNFGFLGIAFTVPLIWAFNVVGLLTLIASGVAMLIYSVLPTKSYSKQLLNFGYKKPLFTVLFFVIALVVVTVILQAVLNISVPLMGSTTSPLSLPFASDVSISVLMSAAFQWPFWLAIVAAVLCVVARLYHKKVAVVPASPSASSVAPQTTTPTATK